MLCSSCPIRTTCRTSYAFTTFRVTRISCQTKDPFEISPKHLAVTRPSRNFAAQSRRPLGLRWYFIAFPGRLSAPPPHDLVESLEIRPRLPVREIFRSLKCRDLLCHRRGHELVDTRPVFPA